MREIEYSEDYPRLCDRLKEDVIKHCDEHKISAIIDAYYCDWEDYTWTMCKPLGLTQNESFDRLFSRKGEFMIVPEWGILRFAM